MDSLIEEENNPPQSCINGNEECVSEDASEVKKEVATEKPVYVISASDLISRKVSEMPTLLKPFLPKVGIAVMAGSSDTGKSAWLRQLVVAVVLKKGKFLNFELDATHNAAIYVSTEDDENSLSYLIQKQNVETVEAEKFTKLRFIFETEKLLQRLDEELTRIPTDLVVVDTLTDLFGGGDFNNSTVVRAFLQQYQRLALKHQCLFIFNHHLAKAREFGVPNKNAVLGSMGIESKARILLELRKDRHDDGLRHLIPLKGNYLPAAVKQSSVVLKFDENMLFSNTGQTMMIEDLAGSRNVNLTPDLKERAAELKAQGTSVREIAKALSEEFSVSVGKSTIAEWVRSVVPVPKTEPAEKEELKNDDNCPVS